VTIDSNALSNTPINGWSDSDGGNISIPSTGIAHADGDAVYYYTQSTVTPGSSGGPTALYCLSQCPTAAALSAFPGGVSTASPFGANTDHQWFSAPNSNNTVTYAFGATGLVESSTSMVLEQATQYPSGSMYAQNGIMTGRLFDTALVSSNCPSGMPAGTVCEPGNPQVYYQWQTGPNQWSQSLWLTKTADSSVVAFDPPVNLAYIVPTGAAYGTWAGKSILLQFNGFGNLFGIPGYCVSPADNSPVDCSTNNSRYVSMFSLPDGDVTMTLAGLHADTADRQGAGCRTQAEEVAAERRGVHGRQRDADEPSGAHRRHARSELVVGRPLPGHRADARVHSTQGDRRRGSALTQSLTRKKARPSRAFF